MAMRYTARGLVIRSENAAKLPHEASAFLKDWILRNVEAEHALDYGCGRMRYSSYLARRSSRLALVDSEVQLDRPTRVGSRSTTLREYAMRRWAKCTVYSLGEFWAGVPDQFDFALCANVLSAIPSSRLRSRSMASIRRSLVHGGLVLFVHQHTNSFFSQLKQDARATRHLDGWILRSPKGASYFGILPHAKVVRLVRASNMRVLDSWIAGQSNYVLANK
jgi:SAM-dependent methyltransferase